MMDLISYYAADPWRLVSLITWLVAWYAANSLSKGERPFLAHVMYSISNILLLAFNVHFEHWELAGMAITFLFTSVRGCFHYWPGKHPRKEVLV